MKALRLWVLLAVLTIPALSLPLPQRVPLQRKLLLGWCRENLEQQYTPGYKATVIHYFSGSQPDLDMSPGRVVATQDPANVAILGQGFFCLEGQRFTRDGRLWLRGDTVVNRLGQALLAHPLDDQGNVKDQPGPMKFGKDAVSGLFLGKYTGFSFDSSGTFFGEKSVTDPVTLQTETTFVPLYRLPIALFAHPQRLLREQETLFLATDESGSATLSLAGEKNAGFVVPRSIELSNVNPTDQAYQWGRLDAAEELERIQVPAKRR